MIQKLISVKIKLFLRNLGIPYKGKGSFIKLFLNSCFVCAIIYAILYVYKLESVHSKQILLFYIKSYIAIIWIFMIILGLIISVNWLKYGEYDEIKFLVSLPTKKSKIYKYKINSLLSQIFLFLIIICLPFVYDMISFLDYITINMILLTGIITGILLSTLANRFSRFKIVITYILAMILLAVLYMIFYMGYSDNLKISAFSNRIAAIIFAGAYITVFKLLLMGNFSILYELSNIKNIKSYSKNTKIKNGNHEFVSFIRKDLISFSRERNEVAKTVLFIVVILGFNIMNGNGRMIQIIPYLIPFTLANSFVLDLAGQESYYLQINKLFYNGSLVNYYINRLLTSITMIMSITLPVYFIINLFIDFSTKVWWYLILFIFINCLLSVCLSFLFRRKSQSTTLTSSGTTVVGQITYYVISMMIIIILWNLEEGRAFNYLLLMISGFVFVFLHILLVMKLKGV